MVIINILTSIIVAGNKYNIIHNCFRVHNTYETSMIYNFTELFLHGKIILKIFKQMIQFRKIWNSIFI